jgi:hypothetical protein
MAFMRWVFASCSVLFAQALDCLVNAFNVRERDTAICRRMPHQFYAQNEWGILCRLRGSEYQFYECSCSCVRMST